MKIKNLKNKGKPSYGRILDVYGIYWHKGIRYYFVIPNEGHEGFIAMTELDTELVDNNLEETFVLRKDDYGQDMFLHWAADRDNLIHDLIDHAPNAVNEFKRRILEGAPLDKS